MEGRITNHMKIRLVYSNEVYEVEQLGTLTPKPVALEELEAGDVGFVVANIKRVADARMGDTVTDASRPVPALPGFEAIKPMVFAGLFPVLADDYEPLRDALGKLQLNDAAFFYERSEEHTSELQSRLHLVCRLLLEKKKYIHHLPHLPTATSANL